MSQRNRKKGGYKYFQIANQSDDSTDFDSDFNISSKLDNDYKEWKRNRSKIKASKHKNKMKHNPGVVLPLGSIKESLEIHDNNLNDDNLEFAIDVNSNDSFNSTESADSIYNSNNNINAGNSSLNNNKKKSKKKYDINPKSFIIWYCQKPIDRFPIFFFVISILMQFVFLLLNWMEFSNMYIYVGIYGIILTIYGLRKFGLIMNLSEKIDEYMKKNIIFAKENKRLTSEVKRLEHAKMSLIETSNRVFMNIQRQKDLNNKFDELNDNLNKAGIDNIEGIKKLKKRADTMKKQWKLELIQNERNLLHNLFDQFHYDITKSKNKKLKNKMKTGITYDEYYYFLKKAIPERYQIKLLRINFWEHFHDKRTGLLSLYDFCEALDALADLEISGIKNYDYNTLKQIKNQLKGNKNKLVDYDSLHQF